MHYLKRQLICDRLRLSRGASYAIVGSAYGPLVSSDDVLHVLNRARRATPEPLAYIPSDLLKPEELAAELAESGITEHDLINWIHRKKNIAPHFRLTQKTIRFSRSIFFAWLDARSRLKSLKVHKA